MKTIIISSFLIILWGCFGGSKKNEKILKDLQTKIGKIKGEKFKAISYKSAANEGNFDFTLYEGRFQSIRNPLIKFPCKFRYKKNNLSISIEAFWGRYIQSKDNIDAGTYLIEKLKTKQSKFILGATIYKDKIRAHIYSTNNLIDMNSEDEFDFWHSFAKEISQEKNLSNINLTIHFCKDFKKIPKDKINGYYYIGLIAEMNDYALFEYEFDIYKNKTSSKSLEYNSEFKLSEKIKSEARDLINEEQFVNMMSFNQQHFPIYNDVSKKDINDVIFDIEWQKFTVQIKSDKNYNRTKVTGKANVFTHEIKFDPYLNETY